MTPTVRSAVDPFGYPVEVACAVVLSDGALVRLRPIRPDDALRLVQFHDQLSGESVHRRFFGAHPHLRPAEVERFTCVDYEDRLALVVEADECLVAVGRYDRLPNTDQAEVAFVVADAYHGHGVGTLLLEHLAAAGRHRGVATFFAETLAYNHPMVEMFSQSGFSCKSRTSQGVTDVSFSITPTERYLQRLMARHLKALGARLAPRQIAGASHGGLRVIADQCDQLVVSAMDATTPVIVVELSEVVHPRRFVAMARAVAQRKPVLALIGASAPCPSAVRELCDQAGIETFEDTGLLGRRRRRLVAAIKDGTWQPITRGTLLAPQECDVYRARTVVRRLLDTSGLLDTGVLDASVDTEELLASYNLTPPLRATSDAPPGLMITIGDARGGLAVRLTGAGMGRGTQLSRVLPLTDRDAQELVAVAASRCGDGPILIDRLARAARLVDDQAEVSGLRLPLVIGDGAPSVWIGRPRTTDDDPFVPRATCT